ncbi:MAG: trypsin-like peptidase domain-containing protein [Candidatus Komeilibacteria bacterium]|nr:trypsin-like peptidase domain-containing protein [Candidatus Komeilibacteria bacterium]
MEKEKPISASWRGYFIPIIIVSLIVGALSGGIAGLVSASLFSGSLGQWINNPLGLAKKIITLPNQNQNTNGSLTVPPKVLDEESATTAAVTHVSPAVVSVVISKEVSQNTNIIDPNSPFNNDFFNQFFNTAPTPQQPSSGTPQKQVVGGGTGFIVTSDGLIVTNKHVVADTAADYSVVRNDGKSYPAKVVARDPFNDVAFLKIEASGLPTVSLGDSDKVQVGQTVIAIGFSLGEYSNSVTKGIISGIGRSIVAGSSGGSENLQNVIQTDAAINPGNSGGPLINLQGQVIGINTAINQSGQLVGFALPINQVKQVIQSVKATGKIVRPYLGVRYVAITEDLAGKNNLPYKYGVLITRGQTSSELAIMPGSPANLAGLEENDIILSINGIKLDADHSLADEVAKKKPGDSIKLRVYHKGQEKDVTIILAEYPNS